MNREQQITELVEQLLETDGDLAEVCAAYPELMAEVAERLKQVRQVEQMVDKLFPSSQGSNSATEQRLNGQFPTIDGYEVDSILGCGGMGVVYKARHQKLNRVVALKMLRAGQFATAHDLSRFSRECQTIAQMHCPHIIQIHDVGDADGRPFFTMEYVDGGSLADQLQGMPQPAREAAEIVATVAEAIHSAHLRGVVHRDLKPSNILLTREKCPKVVDFGLARQIDGEHAITLSGVQLGTPSYMAPEVAVGKRDAIGPAVDVYSLGAVLYELLTGRPPFRAESALETMRQATVNEPVPPTRINASVPRDLETICLKCLNKQPVRRYASAGELAADLNRFLHHEPIHARPVSRGERLIQWTRRNPAKAGLTLTGLALAALAVLFVVRESRLVEQRQAEAANWAQRVEFVTRLERESRFLEARSILSNMPASNSETLRGQILRAEAELNLAERLQVIRMSRGKFVSGGGIDYDESSRQYQQAFHDANLGSLNDPPQLVAQRVKHSPISATLVEALDDWAACATADARSWILEVARRADPNAWRDQVRSQEQWPSIPHLEQLSQTVDIARQPVTILVAMGTRWRRLGGDPTPFLKRVHERYPDDFWLNFELGIMLSPDSAVDSLAYNMAALAIRPTAASVHYNLAAAYQRLNRPEEAVRHFQQVLKLDPEHSWAEHQLGIELSKLNRSEEAIAHFQKALELDPKFIHARNGLRIVLIQLGRLQAAAETWEALLNHPEITHADVDGFAELCLYLGWDEQYTRACQVMLDRFGETADPLTCERIGRACLLKPSSAAVTLQATELIDRSLASELPPDQKWALPYLLFAKSIAELRAERYVSTLALLDGEAGTALNPAPDLVRVMALSRLGRSAEAQQALARARGQLPQSNDSRNREAWLYAILGRQAEAQIEGHTTPEN